MRECKREGVVGGVCGEEGGIGEERAGVVSEVGNVCFVRDDAGDEVVDDQFVGANGDEEVREDGDGGGAAEVEAAESVVSDARGRGDEVDLCVVGGCEAGVWGGDGENRGVGGERGMAPPAAACGKRFGEGDGFAVGPGCEALGCGAGAVAGLGGPELRETVRAGGDEGVGCRRGDEGEDSLGAGGVDARVWVVDTRDQGPL